MVENQAPSDAVEKEEAEAKFEVHVIGQDGAEIKFKVRLSMRLVEVLFSLSRRALVVWFHTTLSGLVLSKLFSFAIVESVCDRGRTK